jgi:hypothetical protein
MVAVGNAVLGGLGLGVCVGGVYVSGWVMLDDGCCEDEKILAFWMGPKPVSSSCRGRNGKQALAGEAVDNQCDSRHWTSSATQKDGVVAS